MAFTPSHTDGVVETTQQGDTMIVVIIIVVVVALAWGITYWILPISKDTE